VLRPHRLVLTIPQLWVFLAIALPVLAALLASLSAIDLAYQVRAGQLMLERGSILMTDPFTFTVGGSAWVDQQWASQVLLAGVFGVAGWPGLAIFRAILVAAIFWLVLASCRAAGADRRSAAWLALAGFGVAAVALALRPQLFGMFLFALTTWIVVGRRAHPRRVWLVPVIVALWANVHGSFFLAVVLLALAWLEDGGSIREGLGSGLSRPPLLAIAAAALVAATVNPFGLEVWSYALGLATNPSVTERVTEWQPTTLRTFAGAAFFTSLGAATVMLARRGRPASWPALTGLAVFALIAMYAQRGIAWWALAAPVILAGLLVSHGTDGGRSIPDRRSAANGLLGMAVAAAIVLALPWWRSWAAGGASSALLTDAPEPVSSALAGLTRPGDRIFAPQPWGSWLELAVPNRLVAVDSRVELFPPAVWDDYGAVSGGNSNWSTVLDRWSVQAVVARPDQQAGLLPLISQDPRWRFAFSDATASVFVRR
jgi:hypothetical protein